MYQTNLSDDNDDNTDDPAIQYTELEELEDKPQVESQPVPIVVSTMFVE